MTRLLLITFLVLNSVSARADWTQVYEIEQLATTVYVDLDSMLTEESLVKLWILFDSRTAQFGRGGPLLSTKARSEFDCAGARTRILAVTDFSGNVGSGKVVYSDSDEKNWEPITTGTLSQTLWNIACGSK